MARKNAELEARGIPTVGLVFKYFLADYRSSARAVGMAHLPEVIIDYAYTSLSPDEIRTDVATHMDAIIASLTTPLPDVQQGVLVEKITTQAGYPAPWGAVELGPVDDATITFTGTDYAEAYDMFQQKFLDWGWSDGFPLIPPTRARVNAMLRGTSHAPDEVLTENFYPARGVATVELIAIQAVMAGAQPGYFPVILAAAQAMIDAGESFILTAQTTSPTAPFFWVNGPIIKEAGINPAMGTLGPGAQSRVNIAIGRATRLIMMNIGGAYVGTKDMDTIGGTDKFSLVTAEDEDDIAALGWQPFHVTQGYKPEDSTITMASVTDRGHIPGMATSSGKGLLLDFARDMSKTSGALWTYGIRGSGGIVLISGDDARVLARHGFTSKQSISEYIAANIRVDREVFVEFYKSMAMASGELEQMLAKYPEGQDIVGIDPAGITVLRVGSFAGKDDFYRGAYRVQTVNIADWK